MDGITLAAQCKRYFPNMRVVIMSACSDKVIPAMGTAVDAVVQKPFSPKALGATFRCFAAVRHVCDSRYSLRKLHPSHYRSFSGDRACGGRWSFHSLDF